MDINTYIDAFKNFFSTGTIYISDALDVILVAILIYAILLLLKRTRSFLILFGVFILGVIYVGAKFLNLYLTTVALQSLFSVLFIVIIVVFQNEIRRFFELIAHFSTRQINLNKHINQNTHITELVQAIASMSHDKMGGLIVLPGRDEVDRFLEGGVLADSVISEELITSLFDPHTPGHDGAMIISKNRIRNFGTHLPLSNNFKEIGKHGTRHSAALGISEQTDCLAIVVSEESGNISVAKEGKLKKVTSEELTQIVNKFINPKNNKSFGWKQIISDHPILKLISITLAVLLWITFAFRAETVQKDFTVPVSFANLPDGILIEDFSPQDLKITLEGRGESSFDQIDSSDLKVNLDTKYLKTGLNTLQILPANIIRPTKLSLQSFQPQAIYVSAKKYRLLSLPVTAQTTGNPQRGYQVSGIVIEPSFVEVWIPEQDIAPQSLSPKPISVSQANQNVLGEYELIIPSNLKLKKQDDILVNVAISVTR